jgi:tetratricopeptide (TPR) repeat protein
MRYLLFALVGVGIGVGIALVFLMRPSAGESKPESVAAVPMTPAEEFAKIADDLYAGQCPQYGKALRETLAAQVADLALPNGKRLPMLVDLANEYLETGEVKHSIETLEKAMEIARGGDNVRQQRKIARELAQAWLREAEDQNCIQRHNAECCILPAREGALHTVRRPAEQARKLYQAVLADNPENLGARWLINLTTLLLGESPDSLPEEQRIPARAFGEIAGEPLFRDVGPAAGVDASSLAGGVGIEDFDGDGLLDVVTSTCDPKGSAHYFRSRGDGTFEDRSESSGIAAQLGGLDLITGDYDEDGDQDVVILRGGWLLDFGCIRRSFLRNDEGEHFEDVTRELGLAEPAYPSMAAVFGDFDADGDLDFFSGNESRIEIEEGKGNYPSQYFRNQDGHFSDVAEEVGLRNDRYTKGVAAGDYDDDGDLDLYLSNIGFNRLCKNDGKGVFTDVAAEAGVLEPSGRSFATWFFDYDEDGHLDLWVNAYSASIADLASEALFQPHHGISSCLYRNLVNGRFENVAEKAGLGHPWLTMGANFGDGDGDGWQDVYLGTGDPILSSLMPNVYLRNVGGQRFDNETASSGLGHLQKGHGIGFADLDGDGDEDIFHKMGGFIPVDKYASALFENRSPVGNHWLELSLVGTHTNTDAVGARVTAYLETPSGPRALHRAPGCVSSFGGSPHRLHVGLGDAQRIARLEVRWPNGGETQVFEDVPLDSWVRVTEGTKAFERLEHKSYRFQAQKP